MRQLIMWNLVTLDGFFEGPTSWEIDWHDDVWGDELEQLSLSQLESADALVFGRMTYQGMASYWATATGQIADLMNRIPKVVFSRTLGQADWSNTTLIRGDAAEEMKALKRQPGKSMFIFGSANLAATFTQHDLIDEYRLCLTPHILGGGAPLFKTNPKRKTLTLVEARPLKSGAMILRYHPRRA